AGRAVNSHHVQSGPGVALHQTRQRPWPQRDSEMMKTLIRSLILGSAAAAAVGGAAFAQSSATQATTASGTIFQPIVLAKNTDLSFGTIVRPSTGNGTVTVAAADGARTLSGSGALLTSGTAAARATYTVTGEGGQAYSVTVPANMTMTRSGG